VDTVANNGAPFDWDSLAFLEAINFVIGLRLFVHDVGVRLSAYESRDGCVKVRKMLFGPVNLYANAA
jgi:hypothetical protein